MGVAAKLSNECSVFSDETKTDPHFQIILAQGNKQIRYYPPYLLASTVSGLGGPELHVKTLAATFVAVLETTSDNSLAEVKSNTLDLLKWVFEKTPFRPSQDFSLPCLKQDSLFLSVSTSFYWE